MAVFIGTKSDNGVSESLAKSFIGEDGEISPPKILASVLSQANAAQANENKARTRGADDSEPFTSWVASKAPKLAKAAGVSKAELESYISAANEFGKDDEQLKKAIVEAGIAGRLKEYSEGDGFGLFDGLAKQFNSFDSNIEYVLTKKGMLNVLKGEIADRAFKTSADNFGSVMRAVEVAYPGGLRQFIEDNATTLVKNKPFLTYINQEMRDMVVAAARRANGTAPSKGYSANSVPNRNAGKTLGQASQPTTLPTPKPNTSVMTGLPKTQSPPPANKGKGNGGSNSKPQSPSKGSSSSNANNGKGNKTIQTGQSANNWQRTLDRYLPSWLR